MEINTAIVAGTGKSGISATKLLVNHGVKVYLFDENKDRDIGDKGEDRRFRACSDRTR